MEKHVLPASTKGQRREYRMAKYFPKSREVRYNHFKNGTSREENAEIIMPPVYEEDFGPLRKKWISFLQPKKFVYTDTIFIIALIFLVAVGTLYCFTDNLHGSPGNTNIFQGSHNHTDIFHDSHNHTDFLQDSHNHTDILCGSHNLTCATLQPSEKGVATTERVDFTSCNDNKSCLDGSHNHTCVTLQQAGKVVITTEMGGFMPCNDNKTCHSFLDVIEQKHDGLKYNFVIGQQGELYISAGFKCLVKHDENALHVKLLRSNQSQSLDEYLKMCFRLSEIIDHGISCGKISPSYEIEDKHEICSILVPSKNRSYHVHDPGHDLKLVHGNFGWSFCGSFLTTINLRKEKVITMENLQLKTCSPLQLVNELIVDIVESQPHPVHSSHRLEHVQHEDSEFNFIINHNADIYVSLGFNCTADGLSNNTLRVKLLLDKEALYRSGENFNWPQLEKYLQIIEQGFSCGKISEKFHVNVKSDDVIYKIHYGLYNNITEIRQVLKFDFHIDLNQFGLTTSSGNDNTLYQICSRKHPQATTSIESKPALSTEPTTMTGSASFGTTTDGAETSNYKTFETSCIPLKNVEDVGLNAEETDYSCQSNETCTSLLETIEKVHDGMKYNFVVGPGGELYIGTGFKCVNEVRKDILYIKVLIRPDMTAQENFRICSRINDVIKNGIECRNILFGYHLVQEIGIYKASVSFSCPIFGHVRGSPREKSQPMGSRHYELRSLVPQNITWTPCEDSREPTSTENDSTTTIETTTNVSCSPLGLVDKIIVDVVDKSMVECSSFNDSSCFQTFEGRHEGFAYNFVISPYFELYVGLGFKCKADDESDNVLKIKIVSNQNDVFFFQDEYKKFLQIVEEGEVCGKINDNFSIQSNCYIVDHEGLAYCEEALQDFVIEQGLEYFEDELKEKYFNITSDHGRGVVPPGFRYQYCNREQFFETPILKLEYEHEQDSKDPTIDTDYY